MIAYIFSQDHPNHVVIGGVMARMFASCTVIVGCSPHVKPKTIKLVFAIAFRDEIYILFIAFETTGLIGTFAEMMLLWSSTKKSK